MIKTYIRRYPDSVKTGYLEYQFCDSIQGLSSYLRGVITTSAVLTAAGVGDAEATAISTAVVSSFQMMMVWKKKIKVLYSLFFLVPVSFCIDTLSTYSY